MRSSEQEIDGKKPVKINATSEGNHVVPSVPNACVEVVPGIVLIVYSPKRGGK